MHRSPIQSLSILLLGIALLSACQTEGQPAGVTTAPLALTPTNAPSANGTAGSDGETPTAAGTTKPSQPGVLFRDDFDGPTVDTTKWKVYEKGGVVRQKDGWLEVASIAGGDDFPFVVTANNIIPESGGWYFETHMQWFNAVNESKPTSVNLDVLPPSGPDDAGYTPPTIWLGSWYYKPTVRFRTGSQEISKSVEDTSGKAFTSRVECDADGNYQVLNDGKKLLDAKSSRRPQHLWIGHYPNAPIPGAKWLHWKIDYVETGRIESLSVTADSND